MYKLHERVAGLLTADKVVRNYLWWIANGEPLEPDGITYTYGDERLEEIVTAMFDGEVNGLPGVVADHIAHSRVLREMASGIDREELAGLDAGDWAEIRRILMEQTSGKIPCGYCGALVGASEMHFQDHYSDIRCWDKE